MPAHRSPHVEVFADEHAAAAALAQRIAEALAHDPALVLGLPTGRTPIALYNELASLFAQGRVDFSQVTTFNLDEFVGIPPSHPGSYRSFMETHLFGRVNIDPSRVNFLHGDVTDLDAECTRYERAIEKAGGISLQILGIGTNGHIGFNEPAPELQSRTHRVRLKPETRRSNAALFGDDVEAVPREALSMGMATILQVREVVLLATGRTKAACVERALHGPLTTEFPAAFLQLHHAVKVVLDRAAAEKLAP
jgi:glucosamine-6-phosphate deaminase